MAVNLKKLRLSSGMKIRTIDAPADFREILEADLHDLKTGARQTAYQQLWWFARTMADVRKKLPEVLELLKTDMLCWVAYPKGSSGIQTDLTRDSGWEAIQAHDQIRWLSLISLDPTWSAFAVRLKTAADSKPVAAPREIFNYADPVAKTVRIPEDLEKAFKKEKAAATFFNGLSFSHRKEYVEWIVTAKKEETRLGRVNKSIEMLNQKIINPNAKK